MRAPRKKSHPGIRKVGVSGKSLTAFSELGTGQHHTTGHTTGQRFTGVGAGIGSGSARIQLTLPERMLIVRRRLGWKQRDIARLMEISEFTVCRNERGLRNGTGTSERDMAHRWRVVEARYKLEIEAGNPAGR